MSLDKNFKLKKNYMYFNITMLCLSIYVILFPLIAKIFNFIDTRIMQCAYLRNTGKLCPLCGGTRYFSNIFNVFNDYSYLLNPFGIIMLFIIFEVIFRIITIVMIKKDRFKKSILWFDIIIHIIAFIAFESYQILFIINNR